MVDYVLGFLDQGFKRLKAVQVEKGFSFSVIFVFV